MGNLEDVIQHYEPLLRMALTTIRTARPLHFGKPKHLYSDWVRGGEDLRSTYHGIFTMQYLAATALHAKSPDLLPKIQANAQHPLLNDIAEFIHVADGGMVPSQDFVEKMNERYLPDDSLSGYSAKVFPHLRLLLFLRLLADQPALCDALDQDSVDFPHRLFRPKPKKKSDNIPFAEEEIASLLPSLYSDRLLTILGMASSVLDIRDSKTYHSPGSKYALPRDLHWKKHDAAMASLKDMLSDKEVKSEIYTTTSAVFSLTSRTAARYGLSPKHLPTFCIADGQFRSIALQIDAYARNQALLAFQESGGTAADVPTNFPGVTSHIDDKGLVVTYIHAGRVATERLQIGSKTLNDNDALPTCFAFLYKFHEAAKMIVARAETPPAP